VLNFHSGFKPQDTDIILTSYPKSGTTWLKALTVTLLERAQNHSSSSSHDEHPLLCDNPHGIVPFLEFDVFLESSSPNLAKFSASPRLFSTHMPLHAMQENLNPSACKIVYVCRNVKDTLISWWFFTCANQPEAFSSLYMFEGLCNGAIFYGPFWDHLLGYWKRSLEDRTHVLFMRYGEMKTEPRDEINKLADFLGCPFTRQEEENGFVDEVLDLCSLPNLSGLEG
ncbi:unnamed protein product, partial [Brassica oleracea var. botrytis]